MDKKPQRPRDASRDESESNTAAPARVRWTRLQLLKARLHEQRVIDELSTLNRDLTDGERERLLRALRNIREIQKVQTAWRVNRL